MPTNIFPYRFQRIFWSIYFALSIFVIGLFFGYIPTMIGSALALLLSPWPKLSDRVRYFSEYVQCFVIRTLLKLQPWLSCEHNLHKIIGFYDQFQTRKVIFVANHRSNLDTFLLISYIPGLRGLAKKSLFQNVFFAPYMWVWGFIPVNKGSVDGMIEGLKLLRTKLLMKERSVLLFPETTRCEKGYPSVKKFGVFFFSMAIESKAIIVPLAINGTDDIMGKGDLFLNPYHPTRIQMLEPIHAEKFQDSRQLSDLVWNQIKAVHDAV